MMRKAALLYVAAAIERHLIPDLGFNMDMVVGHCNDKSGHSCGTTACIAGWAAAVLNLDGSPREVPKTSATLHEFNLSDGQCPSYDLNSCNSPIWIFAQAAFDLTSDQASSLFTFRGGYVNMSLVSPTEAVAELRRLAAEAE